MKYYLSIDFGASSACCILGHMNGEKLITEEVYRFETGFTEKNGQKVWNVDLFFKNILFGMRKCYEIGKVPSYVGIDTWGVDFVLLDSNDEIIGDAVSYRDSRTDGIPESLEETLSFEEMYKKTGIQKQKFNTVYQLASLKKSNSLAGAEAMLMIPDYFNFLLTGEKHQEYTNATTTGLINADSKNWDFELIEKLGLPKNIFLPVEAPGKVIGKVKKEIAGIIGYTPEVVMVASHDTASAIMSIPSLNDNVLYISSGTWSLMGTEIKEPICTKESLKFNFTNEGGFEYRFRYLKNIMGLWMIQSIKKEIADDLSFSAIAAMAENSNIDTIIDVNDESFLAPDSMQKAIDEYCANNDLKKPSSIGEYAKVIYDSLAVCYGNTVKGIEEITGQSFDTINIIGGGSNADYLNRATARATKKTVVAGPSEGTALGNMAAILIATKACDDLKQARRIIENSILLNVYKED